VGLLAIDPHTLALEEQHERRLLVGDELHRRTDADDLLRVVHADTSFRTPSQTSPDRTSDLHRADSRDPVVDFRMVSAGDATSELPVLDQARVETRLASRARMRGRRA
jgi:hypothetical protein